MSCLSYIQGSKMFGKVRIVLSQYVPLLRQSIHHFKSVAGGKSLAKRLKRLVRHLQPFITVIQFAENTFDTVSDKQ